MDLLTVTPYHFFLLGAALFGLGIFGALTRRSAIGILMAIELLFNGVNLTLAAANHYLWPGAMTGQIFIIFTITVAAAEATVGLALVIAAFRQFGSSNADEFTLLNDGLVNLLPPFRKLPAPEVDPQAGDPAHHGGH